MFATSKKWKLVPNAKHKQVKVFQFGGSVAETSAYKHNEEVLCGVIVGMAQDFVGSNNLTLLKHDGQFGTRYKGGKDASASRYIHTKPTKILPFIFRKEDEPILTTVVDEGLELEPVCYYPIIPMILANGGLGIGTGFSSSVPCYNIKDLIGWTRSRLKHEEYQKELVPWYRGFKGTIKLLDKPLKKQKIIEQLLDGDDEDKQLIRDLEMYKDGENMKMLHIYGSYEIKGKKKIIVNELPVGRWSIDYRRWLEKLQKEKMISSFRDMSSGNIVCFEINGFKKKITHRNLKLKKTLSLTNMTLLDENDLPKKYKNVEEILETFYLKRLEIYQKRKNYFIQRDLKKLEEMENKHKMLSHFASGEINIYEDSRETILEKLEAAGIPRVVYTKSIGITSLRKEKRDKLKSDIDNMIEYIKEAKTQSVESLWLNELEQFEREYIKIYE